LVNANDVNLLGNNIYMVRQKEVSCDYSISMSSSMFAPHPDVLMINERESEPPFKLAGPSPEAVAVAVNDQ
jgi:hypothetical protein